MTTLRKCCGINFKDVNSLTLHIKRAHSKDPLQIIVMTRVCLEFAGVVFRWCRHGYDNSQDTDNYILDHTAFEFSRILEGMQPNPKRLVSLLYGATQAGKTFLFIMLNIIYVAMGKNAIILVKDRSQCKQLKKRIDDMLRSLRKFLVTKCEKDFVANFCPVIFYDSKGSKSVKNKFMTNVDEFMSGKKCGIIILIHHHDYLGKITDKVYKSKVPFIFTCDEAHKLGGYKVLSSDPHDPKVKCDTHVARLKKKAHKIFLVTATPQDILITERNLYADSIVFIPQKKSYRGIHYWNIKTCDMKSKFSLNFSLYGEKMQIDDAPVSFIQLLSAKSKEAPIERVNKFGIKDTHPHIVLGRFELKNKVQETWLKAFNKDVKITDKNHTNILKTDWTVLTYNQEGITLYSPALVGETIKINGVTYTDIEGYFVLENVLIEDILDWLAHNGGVEKFHHILILAYYLAIEGMTYSSRFTNFIEDDANWHVTCGYFPFTKSTCSATLEQSIGRCNGNHGDTIKAQIWCDKETKQNVLNGYNLHCNQTKELTEAIQTHGDIRVVDFVNTLVHFENRIPSTPYNVIVPKNFLRTKENPDEDLENQILSSNTSALECLCVLGNQEKSKESDRKRLLSFAKTRIEKAASNDTVSTNPQIQALVKAYDNLQGFVRRIIDFYRKSGLRKLFTKSQIEDGIEDNVVMSNYDRWEQKHNKYRILDKVENNKYRLRQEVIDIFKLK